MRDYRVSMSSEIYDVPLSFFEKMIVVREEKIGDVFFITRDNGHDNLTFSVHQAEYERAKADLRNLKIEEILK